MDKIFIGWSGNQPLAYEVARKIEEDSEKTATVGGGVPTDMYVGAQVIKQMKGCNYAALLVENKGGDISSNLMFEWGYLIAKMPVNNIHTFLINKKSEDLPSDLRGAWCEELTVDRSTLSDSDIAEIIADKLLSNMQKAKNKELASKNYFDTVSDWERIFPRLSAYETETLSDDEMCEYIIMGCLAAYYYMNNHSLRRMLDTMTSTSTVNTVIYFAKSYIDLFLYSDNMSKPLSDEWFFRCMEDFEATFERKRKLAASFEDFLDILSFNAYALAALLYLKNSDLDPDDVEYWSGVSEEYFLRVIDLLGRYEEKYPNNRCLVLLIRVYMYNDIAHLYKNVIKDNKKFLSYLDLSVKERRTLHHDFKSTYPLNKFLETKFEQEYIIALSEQLNYIEDMPLSKQKQFRRNIEKKLEEWEKEIIFSSSLTDRIKRNLNFKKDE